MIKMIKEQIENYLADDLANQRIYNRLLPIVIKNEGKVIGKILEREFKKEFGENTRIFKSYSWHELSIEGQKNNFSLGYNNNLSVEEFKRTNTWANDGDHGRNEKNIRYRDDKKLLKEMAKHLENIKAAYEFFEEHSSYNFPAHYSVMSKFGLKIVERRE